MPTFAESSVPVDKRQLVRGGRLDPHYQITVPDAFAARAGDESR